MIIREDGSWASGWRVTGKEGEWYPCGVLCDSLAVDYAERRIPAELETHPYRCRFIDTTTAAAWRECYAPQHPMTRSDSRKFRMELLAYVSQTCGLVTGSETGHDAAVPHVHYFEGMMSLGPYRVPDAGRDMARIRGRSARRESRSSRRGITTGCRCGNWSTTTASSRNGIGATTTTNSRRSGIDAI